MKLLTFSLLSMITASPTFAQGGHGGGNGGDAFIGAEFYTIAGRLSKDPRVAAHHTQTLLDANLQIVPKDEDLIYDQGYEKFRVEALSFDGKIPVTKVNIPAWTTAGCLTKYKLVLHELFVLKKVEPTVSYTTSAPIIEEMNRAGLDCSGIGEDFARIKLEKIRAIMRDVPEIFQKDPRQTGEVDPPLRGTSACRKECTTTERFGQHNFYVMQAFPLKNALFESDLGKEVKACFSESYQFRGFEEYLLLSLPYSSTHKGKVRLSPYGPQSLSQLAWKFYNDCYSNQAINRKSLRRVEIRAAIQTAWNIGDILKPNYWLTPRKLWRFKDEITDKDWASLSDSIAQHSNGACQLNPIVIQNENLKNKGMRMRGDRFIEMLVSLCEKEALKAAN